MRAFKCFNWTKDFWVGRSPDWTDKSNSLSRELQAQSGIPNLSWAIQKNGI